MEEEEGFPRGSFYSHHQRNQNRVVPENQPNNAPYPYQPTLNLEKKENLLPPVLPSSPSLLLHWLHLKDQRSCKASQESRFTPRATGGRKLYRKIVNMKKVTRDLGY